MQAGISRNRPLHRHRGIDGGGERRDGAVAAAADQGRARHRQDAARGGDRPLAGQAAVRVAHQVHHQGAAGPVRVRRRVAPARFAARRSAGPGHPQLHRQGQSVGSLRLRGAAGSADRRDRQGGHRVPQRSAARAGSHGILRLRDARDRVRQASPGHRDHQQQREGAAGRLPAALLLPLHPLSRRSDDDADRRCAFSGS